MRLGRTIALTLAEIGALHSELRDAVNLAVRWARHDLDNRPELHLERALAQGGLSLADREFNRCFRLVEESVQAIRRAYIFAVARRYPTLIQSDASAAPFAGGGEADFEVDVSMRCTLERMKLCRAVLSVSPQNDMVHDRTLNALNAGCVAIVEDNQANRAVLEHGRTGLLFRYEDNSLRECLETVCANVERCFEIAQAGFAMRDRPAFRFGQFGNLISITRRQEAVLRDLASVGAG